MSKSLEFPFSLHGLSSGFEMFGIYELLGFVGSSVSGSVSIHVKSDS